LEIAVNEVKKKKPTIGLAIIAKNEEAEIEECIDSCKGVDQVSVVDTGSKDRTVEIAKRLGAVVSEGEFNWPDPPDYSKLDFSAARNKSIELLDTDWFVFLDADERLDKGHIWNIRKHIETVDPRVQAVLVTMYTDGGDKFWREKVLKKCDDTKFVGRVHEGMVNEVMYADYANDVKIKYKVRINPERNYAILREELITGINEMRLQYLMGREEFCLGNNPGAVYWLTRYARNYESSGRNHPMRSADAFFTLAMAHARMADFKEAKNWAVKALLVNPDFKEAAQLLADLSYYSQDTLAQQRWMEMANSAQNRNLCFQSRGFMGQPAPTTKVA
jgi:glycosyltransferase involved in cell wall biosynthesis